jgi:hypothetical protein
MMKSTIQCQRRDLAVRPLATNIASSSRTSRNNFSVEVAVVKSAIRDPQFPFRNSNDIREDLLRGKGGDGETSKIRLLGRGLGLMTIG